MFLLQAAPLLTPKDLGYSHILPTYSLHPGSLLVERDQVSSSRTFPSLPFSSHNDVLIVLIPLLGFMQALVFFFFFFFEKLDLPSRVSKGAWLISSFSPVPQELVTNKLWSVRVDTGINDRLFNETLWSVGF